MTGQCISIIAAVAANGVIGAKGTIPWHSKEDLQHFATETRGSCVIMGRKTFASIGKKLAGRHTIIISRNTSFSASGCTVCSSLSAAMQNARKRNEQNIYIAGGGQIYPLAMPLANRLIISRFTGLRPEGDTFFPPIDSAVWQKFDERLSHTQPAFTVEYLQRI